MRYENRKIAVSVSGSCCIMDINLNNVNSPNVRSVGKVPLNLFAFTLFLGIENIHIFHDL